MPTDPRDPDLIAYLALNAAVRSLQMSHPYMSGEQIMTKLLGSATRQAAAMETLQVDALEHLRSVMRKSLGWQPSGPESLPGDNRP